MAAAISHALRNGICWIAAPAGYGKTTAMLDYLQMKRVPSLWYRVDRRDQDIAALFHHLGRLLKPPDSAGELPVFGPEYAEQPTEFVRRFFNAYFQKLSGTNLLVIDDVHTSIEASPFRLALAILLEELPDGLQCACISRTLPPDELTDLAFRGRLTVLDQPIMQFSETEAHKLVAKRLSKRSIAVDISAAQGWAAGLVLLADQASAGSFRAHVGQPAELRGGRAAVFSALARQLFDALTAEEQGAMIKLSLLPEITPELVQDLTGSEATQALLARLQQRQLLVTRGETASGSYRMHDLLRAFLQNRLTQYFAAEELASLRQRTAIRLHSAGYQDAAIDLMLQAHSWSLGRRYIVEHAQALIAQGRRVTLINWCDALPTPEHDAWICYWLGVANMSDDATAESWFARAWSMFSTHNDLDGQCLTAARAVLCKSDSWRTHEGLAAWTRRSIDLIDHDLAQLSDGDQLLVWAGMLRAVDFAQDYQIDTPAVRRLTMRLLGRLAVRSPSGTANLRLMASQTLIDHAGASGKREIFEQAVDSVAEDLRASDVTPWVLGLWLVNFGSVTSRYFSYAKRGFPYASAEEALRAAVAIGEREGLKGVEFGALYHLQLLMKMRNHWSEFATLIARIAAIADSRYTTQVAVAADCEAALHTRQGRFAKAYIACDRFMAAIEAANEPPVERWPHFMTKFQLLLADEKAEDAAAFLEGLVHLFDGAIRRRTQACIFAARVFAAKSQHSDDHAARLRAFLHELRAADWTAVFINLPDHLARLCADALSLNVEPDYCRALIRSRALVVPDSRPAHWPWALRVFVLGEFRLEVDGEPIEFGPKPPFRSFDILRILALAKGRTCALQDIYDWLWPDADGDRAKSACEQALHRLRKMLAVPDVVVQREGKLSLCFDLAWVDLEDWERDAALALRSSEVDSDTLLQQSFDAFRGPLFHQERTPSWAQPAAERVRSKFVELASVLARRRETNGDRSAARDIYLRAVDMYPTSARCYEGLIRNRLADQDEVGALEQYERYVRVMRSTQSPPSQAIRALVSFLLR